MLTTNWYYRQAQNTLAVDWDRFEQIVLTAGFADLRTVIVLTSGKVAFYTGLSNADAGGVM
jgi:hypothetical protein